MNMIDRLRSYRNGVHGPFFLEVANYIEGQVELENDVELLKCLCKELLNGAHKCNESPFYIVQPFLGIVMDHADIIKKHNLL